ncbi:MAG: alpha/beta hydrolase [Mycolicibacterium fortuitum]|uniref:alpha/beta fold hydrolase n=1 Tax=Mycolicibacterium fortuitum TaxID=1766 RepID=UPI0022BA235F|nr:alpha/beta hydrolase [Mycolicibacterium fortuitum]WAY19728.1 alpha/beta hydrolase [Mycolicibacterium fortuitum]
MITETRATYNGVGTRVLSVPGEGVPVVLLHGYGDTADTWRPVLTHLTAAGLHAVAVDLPGFGCAGARQRGPLLPQFDEFVDAILAEIGPAVLVGNSLGAASAVRAADRNPGAVKALVALNDPLNASHWLARVARKRAVPPILWSSIGRAPIPALMLQSATRRLAPKVLYGPAMRPDPQVVAYWARTASRFTDVATLARYAFQYAYETTGGHCGLHITCPTVIVHGAHDRIIPVQASRTLHQQIPGSELIVLPRSGHCPQLDHPAEVARLVMTMVSSSGGSD